MASRLTVQLEADLLLSRSGDGGCVPSPDASPYHAELKGATRAAEQDQGQRVLEVSSPGGFLVLTPAASTLRGTFLWLKVISGGPFDVRVTHETQGNTTYPVTGLLVLEPSDDERITALAVQGEGELEWLVTGDNA